MLAVVLLATFLLSPQVAAASAPAAHLDLTFATADASGSFTATLAGHDALRIQPNPGTFEVEIEAATFVVNWTRETFVEVGHPPDFNQPYTRRRQGVTSGEEAFSQAIGLVDGRDPRNNVIAVGNRSIAASLEMPFARVEAAKNSSWAAMTDAPALQLKIPLTTGAVATTMTAGTGSYRGNFVVYLWNGNISVQSAGSDASFRSGNWTEPMASNVGPSPAYYRHYQSLRIEVENGSLEVRTFQRLVEWHSNSVELLGSLSTRFTDVQGTMRVEDTVRPVPFESELEVNGDGTMRIHNETTTSGLRGSMEIRNGTLSKLAPVILEPSQPPVLESANTAAAQSSSASLWWWSLLLLVPIGALAAVRLDPPRPDITDVEWAILSGHARRARRWSRRLVRREPANADAVFLYASTLLEANRFNHLIERVEPLARKIALRNRRGIAYLVAVAAKRAGDPRRATRWAQEAAADPELRQRLSEAGLWRGKTRRENDATVSIAYT